MTITYVGGIGPTRGTREVVEAISILPNSLQAQFVLVGRFKPPELLDELQKMPGWERVKFVGWQSRERVRNLLSKTRVGVVTLLPVLNYVQSYPTKLFEYMSAGIPVVASDFPIWRQIVEEVGCGLLVDPLNPQDIADALTWLLEHPEEAEAMGRRGQKAVYTSFNWDTEAQKLIRFYEKVVV
jgi:glycosyltransferase involved in cell wall biosynthesis